MLYASSERASGGEARHLEPGGLGPRNAPACSGFFCFRSKGHTNGATELFMRAHSARAAGHAPTAVRRWRGLPGISAGGGSRMRSWRLKSLELPAAFGGGKYRGPVDARCFPPKESSRPVSHARINSQDSPGQHHGRAEGRSGQPQGKRPDKRPRRRRSRRSSQCLENPVDYSPKNGAPSEQGIVKDRNRSRRARLQKSARGRAGEAMGPRMRYLREGWLHPRRRAARKVRPQERQQSVVEQSPANGTRRIPPSMTVR